MTGRCMSIFVDLLRESVLVQGILTLALVGVALTLMLQGREVPKDLWSMLMIVLGFYFGSKAENIKLRGVLPRK